jgi:CRISPR-associated endoribonuclease Cas6
MRITLELSHRKPSVTVPINNASLISSLIYNMIDRSSSEYAERLHEQGYRLENRAFKLFTFSPLNPGHRQKWVMHKNNMSTGEKRLYLTISSPKEEFIEHLILGLHRKSFVSVGRERFRVKPIRKLDPPVFSGDMLFVMLSPLVCSTKSTTDQHPQYLFPDNPDFKRVLVANLCRKYEVLHGKPIACIENDVVFELDRDYVAKVNGKVQKLITLKEGRSDESKVKGTLAPFRLVAPPELIEVGYECGFGEKNAQGFGMVGAIN